MQFETTCNLAPYSGYQMAELKLTFEDEDYVGTEFGIRMPPVEPQDHVRE